MSRQTLTVPELAEILGVSPNLVYREARKTGEVAGVPAIQIGPRRLVFARAQVERMLGATAVEARP